MSKEFIYCFLRKDLEPVQQIIQLGHVCFEAGKTEYIDKSPYMCLFEVADVWELYEVERFLESNDIGGYVFFEPDNGIGHSAICTEIITQSEELFNRFKLFRA